MVEGFNLESGRHKFPLRGRDQGAPEEPLRAPTPRQRENTAHVLKPFIHEVDTQRGMNLTEEQLTNSCPTRGV